MVAPSWGAVGTQFPGASTANPALDVPAGVVLNSILVATLYLDGTVTVTSPPAGYEICPNSPIDAITAGGGGDHYQYKYWKRSAADGTDDDTDTHVFGLSAATYVEGCIERFDNCIVTGNPWDVTDKGSSEGVGVSTSPETSVITTGADRLLVHNATNWAGPTHTQPAGFTKSFESLPEGLVYGSYKVQAVAGDSGSITSTTGGVMDKMTAWLGALKGPAPLAGGNLSISDQARSNMLTALGLVEPQQKSNLDLMKMILDAGGLGLVTPTNASTAVQYWLYLSEL